MPTDLVPVSSTFSTANMKPGNGDDGDAVWAQKLAENTGFNKVWEGDNTKRFKVTFGSAHITDGEGGVNAGSAVKTISFSTKTLGWDNYTSSSSYTVMLTQRVLGGGFGLPVSLSVRAKGTTSFDVVAFADYGSFAAEADFEWLAIGY